MLFGLFNISSIDSSNIFPRGISPSLSKQQGITVPSTSIAICSFNAKHLPFSIIVGLFKLGHENSIS